MEIGFAIVLVITVVIFYASSPKNKVNRACTLYVALASFGVWNEVFINRIAPPLLSSGAMGEGTASVIYAVMTWASYSLAAPAFLLMGLYFFGYDRANPRMFSILKYVLWTPALVLPFAYNPVGFTVYPMERSALWLLYSVFNLGCSGVSVCLIGRSILAEQSKVVKRQKTVLGVVIVPPTVYVLVTVFVLRPMNLSALFDAWQWNVFIVAASILIIVIAAFRNGFLGLKLTAQSFDWASGMDLAGKSAEYTSHMLKNQTAKMEMSIAGLREKFEQPPEELAILSRSVDTLKGYMEKIRRHSGQVALLEEPCRVKDMLTSAIPNAYPGVGVSVEIDEDLCWHCDRNHMTEVFANILVNAAEAMRGKGDIEITGESSKAGYILRIRDSGAGMDRETLAKIFAPYFTTKNTERNFGLGLAYCKNVVEKHGGTIAASSKPGAGTEIVITFPARRIEKRSESVCAAK